MSHGAKQIMCIIEVGPIASKLLCWTMKIQAIWSTSAGASFLNFFTLDEKPEPSETFSCMQRFLDARGQRGSWMPGAGHIFCPEKIYIFQQISQFLKELFDSSSRISHDLFQSFTKKLKTYSIGLPTFLTTFFQSFTIFFTKLGRWMPPSRLDAWGRRTIRTPLCTPLETLQRHVFHRPTNNYHAAHTC